MYNIKALEEEWRRYRRKKRAPLFIGALAILVGVAGAVYFIQNRDDILKSEASEVAAEKNGKSDIYLDRGITEIAVKRSEKLVDAPIEVAEVIEEEGRKPRKDGSRKKLHIEVIDTSAKKSSFKEIEKRFRMGHDIDDSLFLAKSYYNQKKYKKAAYWALQTNKVNESVEESWLLFAKAKAKLGQRNQAEQILKAYIQKTNSIEAKVLLEKIRKGTFH